MCPEAIHKGVEIEGQLRFPLTAFPAKVLAAFRDAHSSGEVYYAGATQIISALPPVLDATILQMQAYQLQGHHDQQCGG